MREREDHDLSFDEFDELNDPRPEPSEFEQIAERMLSRRGFLGGAAALGAAAVVTTAGGLAPSVARAMGHAHALAFDPIATNGLDTVTLPNGFSWHVLTSWGDPMWSRGVAFDHSTRGTGASQEMSFGDNNDGMSLFTQGSRSIMAVNNEYVNRSIIYGNRSSKLPETADDVRKGKAGHGVSIFEVQELSLIHI